jgi:hypothetical protein
MGGGGGRMNSRRDGRQAVGIPAPTSLFPSDLFFRVLICAVLADVQVRDLSKTLVLYD